MDRLFVLTSLVAFTFGCGGTGTRAGGGMNNSAMLSGDSEGKGTSPVDQVTREIPITVSGLDIRGTTAILSRISGFTESYDFIAAVTNYGIRRQCLIQITTFDLLDGNGVVIGTRITDFVTGSMGRVKDGIIYTMTCLGPGETGYLLDLFGASIPYASVASARITLKSSDSEWLEPETSVVPLSYHAPTPDKSYTVTIANQGPVTATVEKGKVLYFDDTGIPTFFNFLVNGTLANNSAQDLAPGATLDLTCDGGTGDWVGKSSKQLVFVEFKVK